MEQVLKITDADGVVLTDDVVSVTASSTLTLTGGATTISSTSGALTLSGASVGFDGTINRVGFFGISGVATRPSSSGVTTGSLPNTDATDATFTGGVGSTAYTVGDIVKILKAYGLLES